MSVVLDDGQWWRTATALPVQDGGIPGTVSNLVLPALALVLCLPLLANLPPLAMAVLPAHRRRSVAAAVVTGGAATALILSNDGHGIAVALELLGMPYARRRVEAGLLPVAASATLDPGGGSA